MAELVTKAPDPLVGRCVAAGKYKIEQPLQNVDIGRVYRGRHTRLPRSVEIWILHGSYAQDAALANQFKRAGRAASRAEHPNVVEIFDLGRDADGSLFLVREDIAGSNLRSLLRGGQRVTPGSVIHVLTQIAAGLAAVHRAGVTHRDLRPENIALIEERDDDDEPVTRVKVINFAHARIEGTQDAGDDSGSMLSGHPKYMSPEQGEGKPLDPRSDIYACGCIAYRVATGIPPFRGSPVDILAHHRMTPPLPPSRVNPAIPAALDTIILRALEKDPSRRYQTGNELLAAIHATGIRPSAVDRAIALDTAPAKRADEPSADDDIAIDVEDEKPEAEAGSIVVGANPDKSLRRADEKRPPLRRTAVAVVVLVCMAIAAGLGFGGF